MDKPATDAVSEDQGAPVAASNAVDVTVGADVAAAETNTAGGSASDASSLAEPPAVDSNEPVAVPPMFAVTCPNCMTSIPLTPDMEGIIPPQSPHYHTCATCNGIGEVSTGSLKHDFAIRPCPDCSGQGYVNSTVTDTAGYSINVAPLTGQGNPPWAGAQWNPQTGTWQ